MLRLDARQPDGAVQEQAQCKAEVEWELSGVQLTDRHICIYVCIYTYIYNMNGSSLGAAHRHAHCLSALFRILPCA